MDMEAGLINTEQHAPLVEGQGTAPVDREPSQPAEEQTVSILLVEDEGIIARDLEETLTRLGYQVAGVASEGAEAVFMAESLRPGLVVMDVSLRGELDGIQAAREIQERAPLPIIFLTGHSDPETLHRAVLTGPLGYLIKPFQETELHCAIEVAIHKHRAEREAHERAEALRRSAEHMQNLSLIDELTQLRNRRGFFDLGQQALKVARRERHELALFFMDLNGLKQINDRLGHPAGDQALRDVAAVLQRTFRDSDILARMGGDEFIAFAQMHAGANLEVLRGRVHEHLREFNATGERPYLLDISIGAMLVERPAEEDLETLIARADAAMYEEKRRRRP